MSIKKNALGKGLGALISDLPLEFASGFSGSVIEIAIEEIKVNPLQPRKHFDQETISDLASSIKEHGVIQPIVVLAKKDGAYQIVVGERRFRAAKIAGLSKIPALIRKFEEDQLLTLALLENLQREDLKSLEVAAAYKEIMERNNLTQEVLAQVVGKSRSSVANTLRLLHLPSNIKKDLQENRLSEGHARALLTLDYDKSKQEFLRHKIIAENLSVREVEDLIKEGKKPLSSLKKGQSSSLIKRGNLLEDEKFTKELSETFGLKAKVTSTKEGTGKIELYFSTSVELARLKQILIPKK